MDKNKKPLAIIVCGATSTGKTKLAVDLAIEFGGEIISADSMQIYKYLDIATAKPSEAEQKGITHHLIDFLEPTEAFSVADYIVLAKKKLGDIIKKGKLPVIAGGTGLYISSLAENITFDNTSTDFEYREELKRFAEKNGNSALHEKLASIDPEAAAKLHKNNVSRIIRALEVYKTSGKKISVLQAESRNIPPEYDFIKLGIDFTDRNDLYDKINERVDLMLQNGLISETKRFYSEHYPTAAQAIGYKELKPYLDGELDLDFCVNKLKQETRNFAKRQLTWFKKDKSINWLIIEKCAENADKSSFYAKEYDKILNIAKKIVKSYSN